MTTSFKTLETLSVGSVESFLTSHERERLLSAMDSLLAGSGREMFDRDRRSTIHEIPDQTVAAARAVYEPSGRVEVTNLPIEVADVLQAASARALPVVRTYAPSARFVRPWTYVEYGVGQFISVHVDRVARTHEDRPRQLLGVSVVLNDDFEGGEFYIETTADPAIWAEPNAPDMKFIRTAADTSADWFNRVARTKWTTKARAGDALLYGSQVAHGTLPITQGRARKFISWFAE